MRNILERWRMMEQIKILKKQYEFISRILEMKERILSPEISLLKLMEIRCDISLLSADISTFVLSRTSKTDFVEILLYEKRDLCELFNETEERLSTVFENRLKGNGLK